MKQTNLFGLLQPNGGINLGEGRNAEYQLRESRSVDNNTTEEGEGRGHTKEQPMA